MNKTQLLQQLETYGLTGNHARVYVACLELGAANIQKICERAGFARSTCAYILTQLQKGICVQLPQEAHTLL
jgi:hypothetical protein